MEDVLLSIIVAIVLAVGLSVVVLLPAYAQSWKDEKNKRKTPAAPEVGKEPRNFTVQEVAKHQTESDCWLIVKDKVYDVTAFVNEHPGGESILNNAGGDNTKGFYGPQHPRWAYERIEEYYIGDIVD